jgi:hypothetical protein
MHQKTGLESKGTAWSCENLFFNLASRKRLNLLSCLGLRSLSNVSGNWWSTSQHLNTKSPNPDHAMNPTLFGSSVQMVRFIAIKLSSFRKTGSG